MTLAETAYLAPEDRARIRIDEMFTSAGWVVQDSDKVDLYAGQGVAVREFILRPPHGRADYLLFVVRRPLGNRGTSRPECLSRTSSHSATTRRGLA